MYSLMYSLMSSLIAVHIAWVGIQMGLSAWFKHILFMTEHDKGLGRAKKLCLALSKTHTYTYNLST